MPPATAPAAAPMPPAFIASEKLAPPERAPTKPAPKPDIPKRAR